MLQMIYGRAGTGKTEYLMQNLCQKAISGRKVMLLVPEQFSFTSEKEVYRRLGPQVMMEHVEVLSFTRLAHLIFRCMGGMAGRRMDEPTRLLLMNAALDEVSTQLQIYAQSARSSSFLQLLIQTVAQFKFAGAGPADLSAAADHLPPDQVPRLGQKLKELSLIYEAFQALVDRQYADPLDDIGRACRLAAEHGFFTGWDLYIDGFMSFTGAELELLKVAVEDCESVTAAFSGLPEDAADQSCLFYSSLKTAARLEEAARRAFVKVEQPVVLEKSLRFVSEGLKGAEAILCGRSPENSSDEGLKLVSCQQPYDEVEYTAAEISALVREKGMRYREIVVICRDMDRYRTAVETVFARYQIPLFMDRVTDLRAHPLVAALLSALEAVRGGWNTVELLNLAKTPVFGLSVEESAQLENYCFVWSVEGQAWENDFVVSPKGLQRSDAEEDRQALEELNRLRRAIIMPLEPLRALVRGCTGREFARGCYAFLQKAGCAGHMKEFCQSLPEEEQKAAQELAEAVWENLMALLDVFAEALGQIQYPLARLIELLQMSVTMAEIGQIPAMLDQVDFGSADRMRPQNPKAVFLLGSNEGIFPAVPGQKGIFSEKECRLLESSGIELGQPVFQQTLEERFFFYRSACCASQWLYILCAKAESSGAELIPSPQVQALYEAFPDAFCTDEMDAVRRVVNLDTAEEELARHFVSNDTQAGSIAGFLMRHSGRDGLDRLAAAESPQPAGNISAESAAGIFGKKMYLSASRIESFYRCPFRYFCQYGLNVEPLRKAEFSPLESGSAIHFVLEQMVLRHGGEPLSHMDPVALHDEIVALMNDYLEGLLADPQVLGARKLYLFNRMVSILVRVLQRLGGEFAQSVFQPAGAEVPVSPDGPVLPLEVEGKNGVKVSVRGSIDRVDLMEQDGVRYARVVDYKSGGKKFHLTDVYYGLNMQMLIYLFALCEGGQGKYAHSHPAGILYFPAKAEVQNLPRETVEDEARTRVDASMSMNGLLLRDRKVLEAMEKSLAGNYIPVKLKKNEEYASSSLLASEEEFDKIRRHVRRLIAGMGESLWEGRVAPCPADGVGSNICGNCDYAMICHNQRIDEQPERPDINTEEFYALLDHEEKEGAE